MQKESSDLKGDERLIWKRTVWISDPELAMALLSREHELLKTFHESVHNSIEWLFVYNSRILDDLMDYGTVELMVNSHFHYRTLESQSDEHLGLGSSDESK